MGVSAQVLGLVQNVSRVSAQALGQVGLADPGAIPRAAWRREHAHAGLTAGQRQRRTRLTPCSPTTKHPTSQAKRGQNPPVPLLAQNRSTTQALGSWHAGGNWATVVGVVAQRSSSYHSDDGLERAVLDLVRVGTRGHGAGTRQLASRLLRTVPPAIPDPEAFRVALHEAMVTESPGTELRFTGGSIPTEIDTAIELADVDATPDGDGLVLNPGSMAELDEILAEWTRREDLYRAGVGLSRTLLLSGPPGVGKTMTARWLAQSLSLPLVILNLSSVVSSYLGSSGRNIKAVLDYAKSGPCVLLLDEFDAIAKRRDDDADIGELKRIVNVVLVELDRWPDTSLLVAATNHPQLLDPAVARRFDRLMDLAMPGVVERSAILAHAAAGAGGTASKVSPSIRDLAAELTEGYSSSDMVRMWALVVRRAVLRDIEVETALVEQLARMGAASTQVRDKVVAALHARLGLSNRQIAEVVGISHPTVAAALKRVERAVAHS